MQIDLEKGAVVLINKPLEWTSFDVVNKIRYAVIKQLRATAPHLFEGRKFRPKVGHAGTLDPLATGLLIVCIGAETKNIDRYVAQQKEYTGAFFIGATTPSFDRETEHDATFPVEHITAKDIERCAARLTGVLRQVPPMFSAIKKDGKRSYHTAREGGAVEHEARQVTISEFEITQIEMPLVHFRIVCSKGTYIRSVARDLGMLLNNGAHLHSLCRTRIGEFRLQDAVSVEDFVNSM